MTNIDSLTRWARDIAEHLAGDKSNDWNEELADLADILDDPALNPTEEV